MVVSKKKQKTKKTTHKIETEQTVAQSTHTESEEKVIADEVVEDMPITSVIRHRPMPTDMSSVHSEVHSTDTTTLLAPGRPAEVQASVSILPQTALVTEETVITETEKNTSFTTSGNQKQVSVSTTAQRVQDSVEITEIDTTERSDELLANERPSTQQSKTKFVQNQSVVVSESVAQDNLTNLITAKTIEDTANVDYLIHDAKVVSEIITSQRETLLEPVRTIGTIASEHIAPLEGIQITEVEQVETESEYIPKSKTPMSKAKFQLTESEPVEVTEIVTENTSDKYYPEIVVATETATKSIVSQKPYVSEVMHAPEKEDIFVPGKLPDEQSADVLLQTRETITVTQQTVQETEESFTGKMKPKTVKATDSYTTFDSVTTDVADTQMPAPNFEQPLVERKQATVEVDERLSVSMAFVDISESEQRLLTPDETKTTLASLKYSLLETSESSQPFINEQESVFIEDTKKTVSAKPVFEPSDAVVTEDSYSMDTIQPLQQRKESKCTEASFSYQLQESTEVTSIESHDKETEFKTKPMLEEMKATRGYDVLRSVQITAQEISEKEDIFDITETLSSHKAQAIPSHALTSATVEEVETSLTTNDVLHAIVPLTTPKVTSGELEETHVTETVPFEGFTDLKLSERPEQVIASEIFNKRKSIQVTTHDASEKEEHLDLKEKLKSQKATTVQDDTFKSVIIEEVETALTTSDVAPSLLYPTTAKLVSSNAEEMSVSEVIPFEGVKDLKKDERPEQIIANRSLDIHRSVEISEQELSEKEDVFRSIKNLESHITPTMPKETLRSIIVEQVELSQVATDVNRLDQKLTTAKVINTELEQTVVSELIPFEGIQDLKPKDRPTEALATEAYDICKSVQVLEQEIVEKEQKLDTIVNSGSHMASSIPAETFKSIMVEEVELSQVATDVTNQDQPTTTAKVTRSEMEQTFTSEVTSYEGLMDLKLGDRPAESVASSSYDIQKSLQITEQETADKEEQLDVLNKFDSHVATTVPGNMLKAIVVEETQTSITTTDAPTHGTQQITAKLVRPECEQTSITEIGTFEDIVNLKLKDKPAEENATFTYGEQKSVQITEQETGEKEKSFEESGFVDTYTAALVPTDTLKSVVVEETEYSMVPVHITRDELKSIKAKEVREQFEETIISEVISFENVKTLKESDKPEENTAIKSIDVLRSIQITTQDTSEKEESFLTEQQDQQIGTTKLANVLESIMVEETLPSQSTGNITDKTVPTTTAKLISSEVKETLVSETTPYEDVMEIQQTEKPEKKTANTILDLQKSITVETSAISEKEATFQSKPNDTQIASVVRPDVKNSIHVEETKSFVTTSDLTGQLRESVTAKLMSSEMFETKVSEIVSFENVQDLSDMSKTAAKKGQPIYDTQEAIVVQTSHLSEQETEILQSNNTIQLAKLIPGHSLVSAIVEDVQPNDSATGSVTPVRRSSKAQITCSEVTSRTTVEMTSYEGVNEMNSLIQPEQKIAESVLQEQTPLIITSDESIENEVEFAVRPDFITQSAKPFTDHVALKTAVVQETESIPSINDLGPVENKTFTAKVCQEQHDETKTTETIVYETTNKYDRSTRPESRKAEQAFDEQTSVMVSTIDSTESDQPLELPKTDDQQIIPNISQMLKSAVTQEVYSTDSTTTLHQNITENVRTDFTSTQLEQTSTSEITLFENVELLSKLKPADKKKAQSTISTDMKNILITETTINETEESLDITEANSVSAAPSIVSNFVAEQQVTQSTDSIIPFASTVSHQKQATTDFEGLKAPLQTQTQSNESTSNLNVYRADDQTAILLQQASEALSVQYVVADAKESDLILDVPTEQMATRQASSGLAVAQQSEVMATNTVEQLDERPSKLRQAQPAVTELSSSMQQETHCEETIDELADQPQVTTKKAKPSVKKIKAPVQTVTRAENTVKPMQEQNKIIEEHAIETTLSTSNKIAETRETTTNETVETFDINNTRETRRASQIIDSFNTSVVEEILSADTVTAMHDTQPIVTEKLRESTEPEVCNTVLVTEINASELTTDDVVITTEQDIAQLVVDTENLFFARSEKQRIVQGR